MCKALLSFEEGGAFLCLLFAFVGDNINKGKNINICIFVILKKTK